MMLLGLIPFAVSLALAPAAPVLSRWLAPWLAAPLLTLLALATALATGIVLCLAAFGAVARLPLAAELGRWSPGPLQAGQPGLGWQILAGAVASALLAAAAVFAVRAIRDLARALRACRALAAEAGASAGRLVIARDDRPMAYAVPPPARAVVVSTGMLRLLSAVERRALLAHEDAHLRQHHAISVLLADLAARANPLLRPLARQVRLATELAADEQAAAEVGDREVVARALARASLAARAAASSASADPAAARPAAAGRAAADYGPAGPLGRLAIAETDAPARVRTLLEPPRRRSPWAAATALALALASATAAITLTLATHQQIEVAQLEYARAHPAVPAQAAQLTPRAAR
jgi:Zn-dependent protease with chaperone function